MEPKTHFSFEFSCPPSRTSPTDAKADKIVDK